MTPEVPRLVHGPGGPFPVFRGKNLYHPDRARERAETLAREFSPPEKCLVIAPSPLLGYGLDVLLRKLPESSRILCVEKEQSLMRLSLENVPPALLGDRRILVVRSDRPEAAVEESFRTFGIGGFRRVASVALNRGAALHSSFYRQVEAEALRRVRTHWRNRMTAAHLARLWVGNLLTNITLLPDCLPIHRLSFEKPVVIAGAGESLETHVPFLRDMRDSISIVAVDTALAVLLGFGLRPDLIVAAEAQFANLGAFSGLRDWSLPVAADLLSYPPILRRFTGERFVFISRFADLAWFRRPGVRGFLPPFLPPLGSVGVMALQLAAELSPPGLPLILAGLDLHYLPGKPHARGSSSHSRFLRESGRLSHPRQYAAWCDRPKTTCLFKGGGSGPVDAVLASYREGLSAIASRRGGVYDLPGPGLDLGIPVLSHGEASGVIGAYSPPAQASPPPSGGRRGWGRDETRSFVLGLLAEMEAAAAASPDEGAELLEALDILTADLPVPPGPENFRPLFLPRLGLQIRKLRRAATRV